MAVSPYVAVGHWRQSTFDEKQLQDWAADVRSRLASKEISIGLLFLSPGWFLRASQLLELIRVHARVPLLVGCSSTSLIAGAEEAEEDTGFVLALYDLPGAKLTATRFTPEQVEAAEGPAFWPAQTGISPLESRGWLVFADPFHMDCDAWLKQWNQAYPGVPTVGGLASGDFSNQLTQIYLNGEVYEDGGVAISLTGEVELMSVIAQGCTPFGETWTITKAAANLIHEIGNQRAYDVLVESFNTLGQEAQQVASGNIFIGLVVNEYLEEFHRGDFLIRNLLGADPNSGSLAVGAAVRPGQTIQFQLRDARSAHDDLQAMLANARAHLAGKTIYGGCLCCCNGRGQRLFGNPHHDATLIQDTLGPIGLSGFFCNGELGPVGNRNFLHGYTASLALFVGPSRQHLH
jgi:small ligand-binding sensory domain FIST